MRVIEKERSARVDLWGGTLDIFPIQLVLENVVTLNAALSLKSKIVVKETSNPGVEINSHDYKAERKISISEWTRQNIYQRKVFGDFSFIVQILDQFPVSELLHSGKGISLEISSQIPPGSGLGGSSVMGITLAEALNEFFGTQWDKKAIFNKIYGLEARLLDCGPTGYQDYYPALYGGILALLPQPERVEVEQLFSHRLKSFLEGHLTLVYSGQTRFSGINNWEVYKGFFDKKESVRTGLQKLADVSNRAYERIKKNDYSSLLELLSEEGQLRSELFNKIVTPPMSQLVQELRLPLPHLGMKVCGAGGGGCFLLIHHLGDREIISKALTSFGMEILPFSIEEPLEDQTAEHRP